MYFLSFCFWLYHGVPEVVASPSFADYTPSFTLLYSMDEISEPELSLKILGHQWFWSYEISDFNSCQKKAQNLKYVCSMMILDGLPKSKQGFMPMVVVALPSLQFHHYVMSKLELSNN